MVRPSSTGKISMRWPRIAILALGGVFLVAAALYWVAGVIELTAQGERAPGLVQDIEVRKVRGTPLRHPVVIFEAGDDRLVRITDRAGLWPSPFEIGQQVEVVYPPGQPREARVVSFWTLWLLPLLTLVFGSLCGLAAWDTWRKRRAATAGLRR